VGKRILGVVLALAIILTMIAVSMYGLEMETSNDITAMTTLIEVDEFSFDITEHVDEHRRLTRTFERDFVPISRSTDYGFANALLLALGFNLEIIDMIPSEALAAIATTTFATSAILYSVGDEYGSHRYISPNFVDGGIIQVHHGAFRVGNSRTYLFVTSGHWLAMPNQRGTGSIGQLASNISVNSSTISVSASKYHPNFGRMSVPIVGWTEDLCGNREGASGAFTLPPRNFYGFQAIITFEGTLRGSGTDNYPMNTAGTYSHQVLNVNWGVGMGARGFLIGVDFAHHYIDITSPPLQIWR